MVVLDLSNAGSANAEARYTANGMVILPLSGERVGVRADEIFEASFHPDWMFRLDDIEEV